MKQFISKVKNLSQKAAEIKAVMQQLPPKVAEVREAVAATTGQLQQLKSEIQFTVADLKAESADHLSQALQEINAGANVFGKAGFELCGVDLELSPVQRLLVHLTRVEDVHPSLLRSLTDANQHQRTISALLSAMLQAKQAAAAVKLEGLRYAELIVSVGPIPSVRLCWRAEAVTAAELPRTMPIVAPTAAPASEPKSVFGQSSFFEPRAAAPVRENVAAESASAMSPAAAVGAETLKAIETPAESPAAEEKSDPLARFKKMPDFSKARK